jgi:hypothetical protein
MHVTIEELLNAVFYTVRRVSKGSLWVYVIPIVVRQRLVKHVPAAMKYLLEASFSVRSVSHERKVRD